MRVKILESASYIALITVCLFGAFRLWQYNPQSQYNSQSKNSTFNTQSAGPASVAGRLPVNLSTRKKWLVLALSTQCRYCIQSAPFHHELLRKLQNSDVGVIAVFPQSQEEVKQYEVTQNVEFPTIVTEVSPTQLQIRGTPTVLLVDQNGTVLKYWPGLLSETAQKAVVAELGLKAQT